jgi:hypothetical protein
MVLAADRDELVVGYEENVSACQRMDLEQRRRLTALAGRT